MDALSNGWRLVRARAIPGWVLTLAGIVSTASQLWRFLRLGEVLEETPWLQAIVESPYTSLVLVALGIAWLVWAMQNPDDPRITDSFLEGMFKKTIGYSTKLDADTADECRALFEIHGLDTEPLARKFFDDEKTRADLEEMYRIDLGRTTGPLDPVGYITWGPPLYKAPKWEREKRKAATRTMLRNRKNRGQK